MDMDGIYRIDVMKIKTVPQQGEDPICMMALSLGRNKKQAVKFCRVAAILAVVVHGEHTEDGDPLTVMKRQVVLKGPLTHFRDSPMYPWFRSVEEDEGVNGWF